MFAPTKCAEKRKQFRFSETRMRKLLIRFQQMIQHVGQDSFGLIQIE